MMIQRQSWPSRHQCWSLIQSIIYTQPRKQCTIASLHLSIFKTLLSINHCSIVIYYKKQKKYFNIVVVVKGWIWLILLHARWFYTFTLNIFKIKKITTTLYNIFNYFVQIFYFIYVSVVDLLLPVKTGG